MLPQRTRYLSSDSPWWMHIANASQRVSLCLLQRPSWSTGCLHTHENKSMLLFRTLRSVSFNVWYICLGFTDQWSVYQVTVTYQEAPMIRSKICKTRKKIGNKKITIEQWSINNFMKNNSFIMRNKILCQFWKNLTFRANMMVKFSREFENCFTSGLFLTDLEVPQMLHYWCIHQNWWMNDGNTSLALEFSHFVCFRGDSVYYIICGTTYLS